MSTRLQKLYSSKASIHTAMTIILNDEKNQTEGDEKQHTTRVISTKIAVDQYDSFNLLAEYLFKTGMVENSTPSALLRNYITQLLSSYHDDIENYRITKKLSTHDDLLQPIIMANTQNKQNLSLDSSSVTIQRKQQLPLVNYGRVLQNDMNTAPTKDKDQLEEVQDRDNLPISYKNLQPSNIHSQEDERYKQIQRELQDTSRELEVLKQQRRKAEEIGGNASSIREEKDEYFRLDLRRFMTVITLIARHPGNQPHAYAYLEPDKNKDIAQIIAPYNFEEYKNEKAAKKIEAESTGTI
jgi:hypothetical protein